MKFYIFGHPIAHSLSPVMHNAAFESLGLPHKYSLFDLPEFDTQKVSDVVADPDFGGASVTIPHKVAIMPLLAGISPPARTIGAVNTLYIGKNKDKRLLGENTDWIGIRECLASALAHADVTDSVVGPYRTITLADTNFSALVIGAGGSARAAIYALEQLGLTSVFIYNRTPERALQIKADFEDRIDVTVLTSLDFSWPQPLRIVIGNVPGDATLPYSRDLFAARSGVLVEMAYKPDVTPLMQLAGTSDWTIVRGTDVLLAQGFEQFRLWTGIDPPKEVMIEAVKAELRRRDKESS